MPEKMNQDNDPQNDISAKPAKHIDFLRAIINEDIKTGKYGGKVVTRFPPEPNGFLHIGHAKSICLNFGIAIDYNGKCNMRFDDTDPTKEDILYVNSIMEDVKWLGFDWGDNLFFASDYFDQLYDYAVQLIKDGKAYVCSLSDSEIKEYRGTVTEPGKHSPYRTRSIEENLNLFTRMKNGEFKDGEHVLRAKIDMSSPNMKMRDPLLYRIRHVKHYRAGDKWCIYPLYDFTHCLSDYIEAITHSICTLEFENNRELYDWIIDELNLPKPRPYQHEFARLNLNYAVMSKRIILELVDKKLVNAWDDPRLSTISGLRRRGYTPEAIRKFCDSIGIAKANSTVDMAQLEFCVRDDLNYRCPRVLCVFNPLKVVITNYPDSQTEMIEAPYFPHDVPKEGARLIPFSKVIYIEQDDFMENPPKGYYRLSPGAEVRLRHAYIIKCNEVIKDPATGKIIEIHCTYDPQTKSGHETVDRKVKGTIHWVCADQGKKVEVRLYDRLFNTEKPQNIDEDLNKDSLTVLENAIIEPSVILGTQEKRFQFERQGYFFIDPVDSTEDKIVFNRIVTLKDSWTKQTTSQEAEVKQQRTAPTIQNTGVHVILDEDRTSAEKFSSESGINFDNALILIENLDLKEFFLASTMIYSNPQAISNWVVNDLMRYSKSEKLESLKIKPEHIAELVKLIDTNVISSTIAKEVFEDVISTGEKPEIIVNQKGLRKIDDVSQLEAIIDKIIADNPDNLSKYKSGKTNLFGYFVGQVLKQTQGKADPKVVNDLLKNKLN